MAIPDNKDMIIAELRAELKSLHEDTSYFVHALLDVEKEIKLLESTLGRFPSIKRISAIIEAALYG